MKEFLLVLAAALIAFSMACLTEDTAAGESPGSMGAVQVQTGFSDSSFFPSIPPEQESFLLSWDPVEGAGYYEVRISPVEITEESWNDAVLVATVDAAQPTDSVDVFLQPEVFSNTCTGCGLCEDACPHDAIAVMPDGKAVIDPELCTQCGECFAVCPFDAVSNSCYGEAYYFAVRAFSSGGAPSGLSCTSTRYFMQYSNWYDWCGRCYHECFILLDSCGPGCPVDAVWFEDSAGETPGLIHIDYDLCIDCGQCMIQCHEYGTLSIRREVVAE